MSGSEGMQAYNEICGRGDQKGYCGNVMTFVPQPVGHSKSRGTDDIFKGIVTSGRRSQRSLEINKGDHAKNKYSCKIIGSFHVARLHLWGLFCKAACSACLITIGSILAGCSDAKPEGQVLAIVDGTSITQAEVRYEFDLGGPVGDPGVRSEANDAVRQLVDRKLLAEVAREQGLEQNPEFHFAKRRMEEMLLVDALRDAVAQGIKDPPEPQIDAYIAANPQKFVHRKSLVLAHSTSGQIVVFDTARLDIPPAWIETVAPGRDLFFGRTRWRVRSMDDLQGTPKMHQKLAKDLLTEQMVSEAMSQMLQDAKDGSTLRYQSGWGPSAPSVEN